MQTYVAKPAEALATRQWWIVDAEGQPLGRLATRIADVLRGKHKPTFTPHVDTGDYVIVINAGKVKVTGTKPTKKLYYTHSGYPGSLTERTFLEVAARTPKLPIEKAVKGMVPKNVLGRQILTKLKVYSSSEHPHAAQQPKPLTLSSVKTPQENS